MSNVAQIIEQIRAVAGNAARIDAEVDRTYGIDRTFGIQYDDPKAVARRQATNSAKAELEEYLSSLDEESLRRVEAVMYSGRNDTLAVGERDTLRVNDSTKDDVIRTIVEKRVSLDPYFERGLDRTKADGIDLDKF